jgi:hypothetical protein
VDAGHTRLRLVRRLLLLQLLLRALLPLPLRALLPLAALLHLLHHVECEHRLQVVHPQLVVTRGQLLPRPAVKGGQAGQVFGAAERCAPHTRTHAHTLPTECAAACC